LRNGYKVGGLALSVLLVLTVVILIVSVQPPASANPNWWNTNWTKRRQITISPLNPENFQIEIQISSDIPKSDYPSIRFLENETSGLLPYWIEINDNSTSPPTLVYENVAWVRRLENDDNTIWMYYHNQSATSAENGDNVFLFWDDFGGGTDAGGTSALNQSKWGPSSTGVDVYQTVLRLEDYSNVDGFVEHGPQQGMNTTEENTPRIIEFRIKNSSTWRGGVPLSGSSNGKLEAWGIYPNGGTSGNPPRFFSGSQYGSFDIEGNVWYVGNIIFYGDNTTNKNLIKSELYYGNDNAQYRQLLENDLPAIPDNWAPGASNTIDKYKPWVWDGGGSSSYYYDWFFVKKWVAVEPIATAGPEESIPGKPLLISPANGAVIADNTPTLQWTIGDNADNHRLLVDNDPDFSSPVENVLLSATDNSYLVTAPLADGNYSWEVIAINAMGENPSNTWTFVVDTVPPAVSSTIPIDNGIDISVKQNVIVIFSETENTSVVPTLEQTAGTSVAYTFSGWSTTTNPNDTATWSHDSWSTNDNITLKVSGYEDLAGNIGDNHSWSFKTKSTGLYPPEILASYTLSSMDVNVYYNIKVTIRDNDNLANDDEVVLKVYENSLSQGVPDNIQNHYTFEWIRGVGFSEVGPGPSNEHLNVMGCSPGSDSVTTDNWTFKIKLDVTATPASWNLWVHVIDEADRQDNQEFANKFIVNPFTPVPTTIIDTINPPFFENEFVKDNGPVLTPSASGFDSYAAYNPAVAYRDNTFYMFYRAQSLSGDTSISRIGMATSTNGINWTKDNNPVISPTEWYESAGCEDPRVAEIDNTYWMTYTAYDGSMARLALAKSYDLENWVKVGLAFPGMGWSDVGGTTGWSKSGAIIPEKINGEYYMYFEGMPGGGDLFYATSEDLVNWVVKDRVLERRRGYFDALTIEPGPTPIILDNGILVIYNSLNKQLGNGGKLTTGWVIFSKDDPTKIIARCDSPFLVPELSWETSGQTPNVVFAEGLVEVNNTWYLYYGAADTVVGLETAPVSDRSALFSVKAQAEWEEGTMDNQIDVRYAPDGISLATADVRGWWKFNENTGAAVNDSSGFGDNGTLSGATWTAGKSGSALQFLRSDTNDVVNFGDRNNLEGFSALTISAWIYPYSYPQSGEIVKKDGVYLLRENNAGSGSVAFMVWDSSGNRRELDVPDAYLLKNQWSLITATWDGFRIRIYKNGAILAGESDQNFDNLASNTNPFTIGNQASGGEGFDGKIDEVMVFNRAITEKEIQYMYNNPGFQVIAQSGEWSSGWVNLGAQIRPENLDVFATVASGENAKVDVEISSDGISAVDNTGWVLLSNGNSKIDLSSLPDDQYAQVKFRLETDNIKHSPSVQNFTLDAMKLHVMVATESASFAGGNSATLTGKIVNLENEETQVRFEWRQKGTIPWNETENQLISYRIPFSDNISGLTDNVTYEFRAIIEDLNSGENTTGQILDFTMSGTPPSPFNLISPENNSVFSTQPVLNWAPSSDNEAGLSHYEVWINGSNIDNVLAGTTNFTTTFSTGLYTWYVVAVDNLGNKRVSENVFKFTLVSPPTSFELVSPQGSYMLDNRVVLNWENSAGTAFILNHYEVWLNGSNIDNVLAGTTNFTTSELPQGAYQWYVVAVDNNGDTTVSDNVFTFNVGTPPPYLYRGSYFDGFENNNLNDYVNNGMSIVTSGALFGSYSARRSSSGTGYAYVSDLSLGQDEAQVSVYFNVESSSSTPGVGFASEDGTWVYAVVYPASSTLQVERRVAGYSIFDVTPPDYQIDGNGETPSAWTERQENGFYIWRIENIGVGTISVGTTYLLTLDFSRTSMAAMAVLQNLSGTVLGRVRAVVDVTPEHPLFLSNGPAKFDNFSFTTIDNWVYTWEPDLNPVVSPTLGTWDQRGAFNPSVGVFDNVFRMVYRGNEKPAPGGPNEAGPAASSLGYATSTDGINWTKDPAPILERRENGSQSLEDPVLLINPFGDNVNYVGYTNYDGSSTPSVMRSTTDFVNFSAPWTINSVDKTTAIIDTAASPWGHPVLYNGENYRFFSYMEPPNVMGFSNDLHNWVWGSISFGGTDTTWSNAGEYPAGAFIMPDGNILVMTCMCADGYVGGGKATVGTAIFSGSQPWVLLQRATLPWAPVYYGNVQTGHADVTVDNRSWYDGPNFPGKNFVITSDNWVYAYYGGNDQYSGVAKMHLAPEFEYRNLTLNKGTVNPGENVVASVTVRNIGNLSGQENVKLYLNGVLENSQVVTLGRDNENNLSFTITVNSPGVYAIEAGGMSATLMVEAPVLPAVVGTTPDNVASVSLNENVVVVFNHSLDASVTPTLTQTTGTPVAYTFAGWNVDNTSATWTHDNWTIGENITLKVSGYKDLLGNTGENYTWSFTATALPGKPTLISPPNGSVSNDNTPIFEWKPGDLSDNQRLLVDNNPDFSSPEENVFLGASENSYAVITPLTPGSYSWKVIAIDNYGQTASSVWTFVVTSGEILCTGTASVRMSGTGSASPPFLWGIRKAVVTTSLTINQGDNLHMIFLAQDNHTIESDNVVWSRISPGSENVTLTDLIVPRDNNLTWPAGGSPSIALAEPIGSAPDHTKRVKLVLTDSAGNILLDNMAWYTVVQDDWSNRISWIILHWGAHTPPQQDQLSNEISAIIINWGATPTVRDQHDFSQL
jgi:predicted GH43/DUF377 family glycosyl hydrolase